ncbi:hypothetical protein AX769_19900 [Frondihabitans sp. PAMC 28766]|nr:hypothetical protein AX769_19900 [Frondihabitans sp. PAMC 28766]
MRLEEQGDDDDGGSDESPRPDQEGRCPATPGAGACGASGAVAPMLETASAASRFWTSIMGLTLLLGGGFGRVGLHDCSRRGRGSSGPDGVVQ